MLLNPIHRPADVDGLRRVEQPPADGRVGARVGNVDDVDLLVRLAGLEAYTLPKLMGKALPTRR